MKIKEPDCVLIKRKGAEYVKNMLSGKSQDEIIKFWAEKTSKLKSKKKNSQLPQN